MYDKFDKLQVTLTNVLRTQLAVMTTQLEERLEVRFDRRIADHLQLQTEQLRDAIKALVETSPGAGNAFDLELLSLDDDVNEGFPADDDEFSLGEERR